MHTVMQHADPSPAARFERVYPIRFSHCDPAGIVFFPQYLVLFNHLVEDWFTEGLGVDYAQMLGARRIGLPIVRLECDFRAISRMGDAVTFGLVTERVGGRSLTLALTVSIVNAMNFVDGLDGLAAGLGLITALAICALPCSSWAW